MYTNFNFEMKEKQLGRTLVVDVEGMYNEAQDTFDIADIFVQDKLSGCMVDYEVSEDIIVRELFVQKECGVMDE